MFKSFSFLVALMVLGLTAGYAKNRASVHGKLIDSLDKSALEFATVAIVEPKD